MVVMTPIEVNREGSKEALREAEQAKKGEESQSGKGHFDIKSIRQHTAFQYALDVCLSVYADNDMKDSDEVEVAGVFERDGKRPPALKLFVDGSSKKVVYAEDYRLPYTPQTTWGRKLDDGMVDDLLSYR